MRVDRQRCIVALFGGTLLIQVLAGCSSNAPPVSKEEQASFKGGPMPESARKIMQEKMQAAQKKMPEGATAGPH